MRSRITLVGAHIAAVAAVFLWLAPFASAQTPATDQYGTKVAGVAVDEAAQQPTNQVEAAQSDLPNTGLPLLGTVVVGGALVAFGVALRWREQRTDGPDD